MTYSISIFHLIALAVLIPTAAQASAVDALLHDYAGDSVKTFSTQRGKQLWAQTFLDTKSGSLRSCASCHTNDLTRPGKHQRTRKTIAPLSPSSNEKSLRDAKHIKKWLKRNCKWTLGRECTPQEKGDLLTFIQSQ